MRHEKADGADDRRPAEYCSRSAVHSKSPKGIDSYSVQSKPHSCVSSWIVFTNGRGPLWTPPKRVLCGATTGDTTFSSHARNLQRTLTLLLLGIPPVVWECGQV